MREARTLKIVNEAPVRVGPWEVGSKLASRGAQQIYEARDPLGRRAALKIYGAGFGGSPGSAFEARVLARIAHPNVTRILDWASVRQPYIAYELVPGETLEARVLRAPLELSELARIGEEALDALDAVHASRIAHRRISARRLIVEGSRLVLIGFRAAIVNADREALHADLRSLTKTLVSSALDATTTPSPIHVQMRVTFGDDAHVKALANVLERGLALEREGGFRSAAAMREAWLDASSTIVSSLRATMATAPCVTEQTTVSAAASAVHADRLHALRDALLAKPG